MISRVKSEERGKKDKGEQGRIIQHSAILVPVARHLLITTAAAGGPGRVPGQRDNQQANGAASGEQSGGAKGPVPRHTTGTDGRRDGSTFCTELVLQPPHTFSTFRMWKQTSPRVENCAKFS